jgi:urease subunit gamma/beta
MLLGPKDEERLRIFEAAELARRTLQRGIRLNAPEAIALVCDEMHMAARSGATYDEVREVGLGSLAPDEVMEGVAEIAAEIRVEVLLAEGTRLVVLREPFGSPSPDGPGAVRTRSGEIELGTGRARRRVSVRNTSGRPIRVSSHYPFWRTNPALEFDREGTRGFRLDLPAGDALRWAPGETREVDLVAYGRDEDA